MSNYVVSARKYRPTRFEDVVGQEHVALTLKNALKNDHLAHAFLFCGPRGVGKTTCARILAKVLNCQSPTEDFEPCNECGPCKSFSQNASFNITELDAASNNSVEHIRALIEQVRFQPQQGRYKVFIIDEVHMLSQQAFNAFLKTLEEPPPYAIFILATTEKHKIIPTIQSRCQIFDFKRIQIPSMVKHLASICAVEGIEAESDALHIIAQKADGALRDALSIFDRIVAFSGKKIIYEDVISNLNVLDYDYYFKMVDGLMAEDLSEVLLIFEDILQKGFDGDIFINGLAEHLRNLLVCKDPQTLQLLEVSEGLKERYQLQSQLCPTSLILTALNLANDCDINYKMARNKRLHVEMAIIKMTYILRAIKPGPQTVPVDSFQEKKTPDLTKATNTAAPKPTPDQKTEVKSPTSPPESDSTPPTEPKKSKRLKKFGAPKVNLDSLLAEVNEEDSANGNQTTIELTQEYVQESWNKYMERSGQQSLKSMMKQSEIRLDGSEIVVTVGSTLSENTIRQESQLMDFLRQELQRPDLILTIKIDKSKAPEAPKKQKPLTAKEKFLTMEKVNPLVRDLYKRFNLRPDE